MKYIKLLRQARANAIAKRATLRAQTVLTHDRLRPQRLRDDALDAVQNFAIEQYETGKAAVRAHPVRTGLVATVAALWLARRPLGDLAQSLMLQLDERGENSDEPVDRVMERSDISGDYDDAANQDDRINAADEDDRT